MKNLLTNKESGALFACKGSFVRELCIFLLCVAIGGGYSCDDSADTKNDTDDSQTDITDGYRFALPDGWTRIEGDELKEYGSIGDGPSDDPWAIDDSQSREILRGLYEKCEIALDKQGLVRARCTEAITWEAANPCPRARYKSDAYYPLTFPGDDWSYCVQGENSSMIHTCRYIGCHTGHVCEGSLRNIATEPSADVLAFCLEPSTCLQVASNLEDPGVAPCFYEDLTLAESGEIPEQNCEALEPHECATNCSCGDADATCRFLSEQRPIGLCSAADCSVKKTDQGCEISEAGLCVHHTTLPEWVSEVSQVEEGEEVLAPGACATLEDCKAYQERYPGVYTCGYE